MQNHESAQPGGNLRISREVLATIARYAALEIEGVDSLASLSTNIKGWLLKKQPVKPISIDLSDGVAVIDLRLVIQAGHAIPVLCEKVQAAVKEAIQNMTGIAVSCVNIFIAGIAFMDADKAAPAAEA